MVLKEETISKSSRGLIVEHFNAQKSLINQNKPSFGMMPAFDPAKVLSVVRKDSTVIAGITTLVDKSIENGYDVKGKDGKSNVEEFKKTLDKIGFDRVLRQIFYNLYTYNNVFVENVPDGNNKPKELHILETTHTEPVADKHGEVLGYIQMNPGVDADAAPTWTPDEVTHIATTKLTTSVWGELDIQSVYTSVLLKQYIYQYLGWLFGTNQFKGFYNIKNANDKQIKGFLSHLKKGEVDISQPIIAEGEVGYQIIRDFGDGKNILDVIGKCDENILTLLQVPPVLMGQPGDSNRSNSDAQFESLATRIKSAQELVAYFLEKDLFPKMGFDKIDFIFNLPNKFSVTRTLENAERMLNMGFKQKKVEEYLKSEGFPIEGNLFDPKVEPQTSDDMFPSRKGKPEDEGNTKVGTGEAGTTREDQFIKRSGAGFNIYEEKDTSFAKYPYTY